MGVYKVIWYTLLEFLLLQLVKVNCAEDVDAWRLHERTVGGFSCGPPQPRSFRLDEIMDDDELPDIQTHVFPKMTVLYRCDSHSGCCQSRTKQCAPQVLEEVRLTFRLLGHAGKGSLLKEKYINVATTNHTRCSCQTVTGNIK
ncbi:hypothetical protein PPYR_10631 [Photinus pyralis]|uniref:Platelet-derived growth factor (PDGF) family profile domain-containing protein n=1 Tax=Photinus pyralis TaxID=7054 RepID=A0A1Y1LXK8_PHOPY|nr:uncharacterized protein LOC116173956 [Photinus pyralis]KAB0796570.1 hypothetical protein PPYR_10631 [Photinus pyralis]